jgi:hypothetical protein
MESEPVQLCFRPWINRFADHIPDAVVRLRFLQAVAPEESAPIPVRRRWRRTLRWALPPLVALPLLSFVLLRATPSAPRVSVPVAAIHLQAPLPAPVAGGAVPAVWQVEQTGGSESYSNGLRIDNRFAVSNHARSYWAFPLDPSGAAERGSQPVGILFHTTESRQAPFEERQTRVLKRIGKSLLEYVQHKRAYNFVIDRFGRVYRIVVESDAANHAGHSVWSDERRLYVNLNESFLAVSVEAQTEPGQLQPEMSPAQVHAGAMLTEMLRSRYGISASNCVTHAQVSVNPSNMRIGYHTDWASSFPFSGVGLPDNYARPLPAVVLLGFEADRSFDRAAGVRMAAAVDLSERQQQQQAAAAGLSLRAYRKVLQDRYWHLAAALHSAAGAGTSDE